MKTFYNLRAFFSSHGKSAHLAQCLTVLAIVAWPSSRLFAQSPAISYSTPQTLVDGTAISALSPVNTGGAVSALHFNSSPATVSTGVNDANCVAIDKLGNMYIGESSGQVSVLAAGGSSATVLATGFTSSPILSIAVDQSGAVYLADGQVIWKIPATGVRTPVVIDRFDNPKSVAVGAVGHVYVADIHEAEELDSNGGFIENIGEADILLITADQNGSVFFYDTDGNVFKGRGGHNSNDLLGTTSAAAITTDASGNFYTVTNDGRLVIAPQNGAAAITIGSFPVMKGMAVDANFNIYGALNGNIIKVSAAGGYFTNPELPSGLSIDGATGVISGTPSGTSAAADYKVTAFNSSGSGTATINITVNPALPSLSYSSPQSYQVGTAISALSPASSRVASWGYNASAISIGSGIIAPVDVAADAAGNVYVADVATNNIVKIPAGNGTPVVLAALTSPFGIAVDGTGNVYVAASSTSAIIEYPSGGGAPNVIGSGFIAPSAVAVDGSGNVYVGDAGNGALKEVPAGNGTPVTIQSGFNSIQGVAVDAAGNIYVADGGTGTSGSGAVYKIPAGGGSMVSIGTGFSRPNGVVADAAGNLYIADIDKNVITVIEQDGTQFTIGSGFSSPNGVTIDGLGNVYLADTGNGRVKEVKINGGYFLSPFLPAGLTFNNNTGVISGTPTVTAAAANYTATAYNVTGPGQATVNITVGAPIISYNSPEAYATGAAITPLAPTVSGGTVAGPAFNANAITLATGLSDATCLAVGPDGSIYVGESSGQVSKLAPGGNSATVFATGFATRPTNEGLAVDASGNVYLADGASVWKIPAGGGTAVTLGSFTGAAGVSLDAAGNIYVADESASPTGGVYKMAGDGTGKTPIVNVGQALIALDPNGNVFYAAIGNNLNEVPAGTTTPKSFHFFSQSLREVSADLSGNIYALTRDNSISMLPANGGAAIQVLAGSGTTTGIAIDANFNMYTVVSGNIVKINATGGYFTSPQLPNGLTIDPNTGVISGTPAAASAAANYSVSAFNVFGNAQAALNITVGPPPVISYSTPQTYIQGSAITALLPSSTGAPISALGFSTSVTLSTGITDANCMAMDKNGNIYIGESSGKVSILAPGASIATVYATGFASVASYTSEGIAVDASGNVYFADLSSVWKIPAGGGTPFTIGSFRGPGGVAVDTAGNVYVADQSGSGGIYKMAGDGSGQTKIGSRGVASGLAADANGNVFIVDELFDELYEIPAGGTLKTLSGFGQPSCVAVDASGNVYIGQMFGYGLQFISAGGRSPSGIGPNFGGQVTGLMVDPNFNLYVANDGIISKISAAGGYFVSPELPNGLTINPNSGAISGTPSVVSPATNYTVTAFSSSVSSTAPVNITVNPSAPTISYTTPQVFVQNTAISPLSPVSTNVATPGYLSTATTAGSFPQPFATAVDQSGNVYVADKSANSIYELLAGGGQTTVGTGLNTPAGVAVDKSGNIYTANQGDNTVVEIQAHTGTQSFIGSGYQRPTAIAVDSAGSVFVADVQGAAGVVYKIRPGHNKVLFKAGFVSPNGLAVDATGNVYVSDFGGGATPSRVYKISPGGAKTSINHSFSTATGVAIDATGNLFIVDGGNLDIIEYPAGGGSALTLTAGLTFPFGISADGAGNLYVADPGANKVVKLAPDGGYFINRALPAGLSLNAATGVISGTPIVASPATAYSVAAYNIIGGSGAANLNIAVTPISKNANLSNLQVNSGTVLSPAFHYSTTGYTASVKYGITSVRVTPSVADTHARVTVNNIPVTSKTPSGAISLNVGPNVITTVVTAQDGTTSKTYTITVTREQSANAMLSKINLNSPYGPLTVVAGPDFKDYTATVNRAATSITLTAVTSDPAATMTVNGNPQASGSPLPITLNAGNNTITIVVKAADGLTTNTYVITVTRALSNNAYLSAVNLKPYTALTQVSGPDYRDYTASVANTVSSAGVIATSVDSNATITVNGAAATSGIASAPMTLAVGDNTFTVIVKAQDGVTTQTYVVIVNREAPPRLNAVYQPASVAKPVESPQIEGDGIMVHQGISPNGDGQNDYLVIDGISNYPDNKLMIMNRNGMLVYEAKGYDNSSRVFDGHSGKNGAKQQPGTYFYSLDYTVKGVAKHKTGYIVLKY